MKITATIAALSLLLPLAACNTPVPPPTTLTAQISTGVADACAAGAPVIARLQGKLTGGAAETLASIAAACTVAGQVNMTINDTLPVTPTNSGDSPTWVVDTLQALQIAAAAAPLLP